MIFPYLPVSRFGTLRLQPIIPVRLMGMRREQTVFALVDSGAEQSVFSLKLVNYLGLETNNATAVEVVGVGGAVSQGYLIDLKHQLGRHQWTTPVVFSTAVDSPAILGQAGFFNLFTVTFKRRSAMMDIRRAR